MLSQEQLEQRRAGITATDVAAIVGQHPHRSSLDVCLEKWGEAPTFDGNEHTKWGNLLEPVIRTDYEERHGVRVEVPGTLVHPDRPWQMATPDGLVYLSSSPNPERGLEIKVHNRNAVVFGGLRYGDPGTDDVPAHELIQCVWNIDVAGVDRWDLIPFLDGAPHEYIIDRDDELIEMLVERSERFYRDHVLAKLPPPPDGGEGYSEWLKRRWEKNGEAMISVDGDTFVLGQIEELRKVRAQAAELEVLDEQIVQALKLKIGDNAGMEWSVPGQKKPSRITWKRNKPGTFIDHVAIMSEMRQLAALVASGKAADFERAITCLKSIEGDYIGRSSRAVMTAEQMIELLEAAHGALLSIQRASMESKHTKPTTGNRPFCVPRNWKAKKES